MRSSPLPAGCGTAETRGPLRYCREAADTGKEFTCASDVILPEGRWVLRKMEDQPSPLAVVSAASFYSPDLDRALRCEAAGDGGLNCG